MFAAKPGVMCDLFRCCFATDDLRLPGMGFMHFPSWI